MLLLALLLALPLPKPPGEQCPANYRSEAQWCVPADDRAPVVVPKGRGQCPSTMVESGGFCVMPR